MVARVFRCDNSTKSLTAVKPSDPFYKHQGAPSRLNVAPNPLFVKSIDKKQASMCFNALWGRISLPDIPTTSPNSTS